MADFAFGPAKPAKRTESKKFVLCTLCRHLSAEAAASNYGYPWHEDGRSLMEARGRCSLCRLVYDSWNLSQDSAEPSYTENGSEHPHSLLNVKNLRIKAIPGDPGPEHGVELKIQCESFGLGRVISAARLYLGVPSEVPLPNAGFFSFKRNLTNTASEETFAFIRACLSECDLSHDCTSPLTWKYPQPDRSSRSPARLIDTKPSLSASSTQEETVRLVEVGQVCPPYITLSHCWGKTIDAQHITTKSNMDSRQAEIRVNELPLNFIHAVQITKRLGVRYLWIDSLCIIQDSAEDWRTESVKMGAIYQGAFLTISANMGGDSTYGCFNRESRTRDQLAGFGTYEDQLIDITTQNEKGEASTVYVLKQSTVLTPSPLKLTPLSDRGWIFQERLLSPRTLHFTPTQLVWECRCMYRLEDLMPTPYTDTISPTTSALLGRAYLESANSLVDIWHSEVVQREYSNRLFTKPDDKLIAIAGIAQIMQHHFGCAYLAGLWEDHLAYGLSFWLTGNRKLGLEPRRPTWSWCSHDREAMWYNITKPFRPDPHFCLMEKALEYAGGGSDPFSPVSGGSITIKALSVSFTIAQPPALDLPSLELSVGDLKGKCRIDYPCSFTGTGKFPQRPKAILLGHSDFEDISYLLVVERTEQLGTYQRIGLAYVWFLDQAEDKDTFWLDHGQGQQIWKLY